MPTESIPLELTAAERLELEQRVRLRTGRAEDARRARLILALHRGDSYTDITRALSCNRSYVSRWKERFVADRRAGLYSRNLGREVEKEPPKIAARILTWTLKRKPRDGSQSQAHAIHPRLQRRCDPDQVDVLRSASPHPRRYQNPRYRPLV
jgi:Homeodomain-like domain